MKTNIEAFKALIIRYRSITIEEIENAWKEERKSYGGVMEYCFDASHIMEVFTGFSRMDKCSLCLTGGGVTGCGQCVWSICNFGDAISCLNPSYVNILHAKNSDMLLKAIKERADVMGELIKDKEFE